MSGKLELVKLLLQRAADPNAADKVNPRVRAVPGRVPTPLVFPCTPQNGTTALMHAATLGNMDIIEALALAGAQVSVADFVDGWSPLMRAVVAGHLPAVQYFHTLGAKLDEPDFVSDSSPVCESFCGLRPRSSLLCWAQKGFLPLQASLLAGRLNVMAWLIEKGQSFDSFAGDQVWDGSLLACPSTSLSAALYYVCRSSRLSCLLRTKAIPMSWTG